MSEAVSTARSAREALARGLSALQSNPNVPPEFLDLAEPIAMAMGALHRIERSQGRDLKEPAETALSQVRNALAQLQAKPLEHPAIMQAMEAVASSLSLVHSLSRVAGAAVARDPQPAQNHPPTAAMEAAPTTTPLAKPGPPHPQAQYAPPQVAPPQAAPPQAFYQPPVQQGYPQHQQTAQAKPPQAAYAQAPQAAPPNYAQHPYAQQPHAQPQAPARPAAPAEPAVVYASKPAIEEGLTKVNAELGAHSSTNFYKGLAGNDIIEHGGLFVATHSAFAVGAKVRLHVSLPGGYEFEAQAIVRWLRAASEAGVDAPPGFGVQFTSISPDARQLVYRYVRNREPLFYDDL